MQQNDPIVYVDRPEILESFIDSVGRAQFSERVGRIELCVTRLEKANPPEPPNGKRYPVVRAVLTPQAIIDLFRQLEGMMVAMQQEGIIKMQKTEKPQAH